MKNRIGSLGVFCVVLANLWLTGCEGGSDSGTAGTSQAILAGPLADATIEAYTIDNPVEPIESTVTRGGRNPQITGTFDLSLDGVADDKLILVTVTGGTDIGSNRTSTPNSGTLYGLAPASMWRTGGRINALTDIYWRYCQDWSGEVSPPAFSDRLGQIAMLLITQDLDGNGLGASDLMYLDPRSLSQDEVNFEYANLFKADGYAAKIYANALDAEVRFALGDLFGPNMAFSPPVQMEEETKLILTVFGGGSMIVESQDAGVTLKTGTADNLLTNGEILLNTVDEDADDQRNLFLARSTQKITLRAVPVGDTYLPQDQTQILSWDGCDTVSVDQALCTVDLQTNRVVTANFGYKQTTLAANTQFIDLTDRAVTVLNNWDTSVDPVQVQLDITVNILEADLLAQLDIMEGSVGVSYFLAGIDAAFDGSPFLLKVNSVVSHDANHWVLNAEEAALGDFIDQGTGLLERTMYPEDLVDSPVVTAHVLSLTTTATTDSLPNAYLVPSSDPNDPTFHIVFGQPSVDPSISPLATKSGSGSFTIDGPGGSSLTVSGTLDLTVAVEAGIHFKGFLGMKGVKSFKFIPKLGVKPQISVTGDISCAFEQEVQLMRMEFSRIKFMVGPVPVWITPTVVLVLGTDGQISASVSTGVTYDMSIRGGVRYKRGKGVTVVKESSLARSFVTPELVGDANLRAYVSVEPIMYIYDLMGPHLKIQPGLGLNATLDVNLVSPQCFDMSYGLVGSVDGKFTWSMEGKLAKLVGLEKYNDNIPDFQIFHWDTDLTRRRYNPCSDSPSALKVLGDMSELVMVEGTNRYRSTSYEVVNDNDNLGYTLPWTVQIIPDAEHIQVGTMTGQVAAATSEMITVEIDNTFALSPGTHTTRLVFTNTSSQSAADPRTIEKYIRVKVIEQLAEPMITQGERTGFEVVTIDWRYDGNVDYLDGFNLLYAETVEDMCPAPGVEGWEKAGWVDRSQRSITTAVPYGNFCFEIEAVGKPGSGQEAYSSPYALSVNCDLDGDEYNSAYYPGCGGSDCCDDGNGTSMGCTQERAAEINPGTMENNVTANCGDLIDNNCDGEDSFCAYGVLPFLGENPVACIQSNYFKTGREMLEQSMGAEWQ